jgi:hypothetical protein
VRLLTSDDYPAYKEAIHHVYATDRHKNARKVRKTYTFSKDGQAHEPMIYLTIYSCAPCKGRVSPAGASPARPTRSLRPEAIGAAVEVTKPSEPSRLMYRSAVQRAIRP